MPRLGGLSLKSPALTPLEVASGIVNGLDPETPSLPRSAHGNPRQALEERLLELLSGGPCVVALSGGRDSSALLALAVEVARRHGLELPAAVSLSFPESERTDESGWQERLVRGLGMEDWRRLAIVDELDLIGPFAREAFLRHGLLLPPNSHLHVPLLREARGATLISGVGGDEAFDWRYAHLAEVARLRTRPRGEDLRRLAVWLAPTPLARWALVHRPEPVMTWLTPNARAAAWAGYADKVASGPRTFAQRCAWLHQSRYLGLTRASLRVLAEDAKAGIALPLAEPGFLSALARLGGRLGPGPRERVWRRLFGDVLPEEVLARRLKADYGKVLFGAHSRAFSESWSGEGADPALVDVGALQTVFQDPRLRIRTGLLLQALWLADAKEKTGVGSS